MRLAAAALLLALTACAPEIDIPTERHAVAFEWRPVSPEELRAAYVRNGQPLGERDQLDGFVGRDEHGWWVIYTLEPKRLDDRATCTIGHEVLHIVAGDYHE